MDVFAELKRLGSLIRQLQGALQGENRVRGVITSAGAITAGTGFTVSHPSAGHFTITFDIAFGTTPAFVAVPLTTGGNASIELTSASTSAVTLITFTTSTGTATDFAFHFIAVG